MSYRTVKRVLGETSLERKCNFLFGACLLLLITGSFMWYGRQTENLVHYGIRSTSRQLVDSVMVKIHWVGDETESYKEFSRRTAEELENLEYKWEFISLDQMNNPDWEAIADDGIKNKQNFSKEVGGPRVVEALRDMKDEWDAIVANADGTSSSDTPAGDARYGDSDVAANVGEAGRGEAATALAAEDQSGRATTVAERHQADGQTNEQVVNEILDRPSAGDLAYDPFKGGIEPPWRAFQLPDVNEYHYYQVVMWKDFCTTCHATNRAAETIKLADSDTELVTSLPFVVVKVVVPFGPTKWNINKNRAMLVTTAIITVALAMGALYVVVRYVIVKPLTHLRDISDEIGRGNYALRAEIETNDEFEDLARSYNRMLRHLVEAQEKLRAVNANLDAKVDQLAQANMQLYEMNRLKSDFLANMSHELRTPLNSIIGFSDVLSSIDNLNDKQKRYVSNIGNSGRVLLDMINDILDLAKMESGKMEIRPAEFSIATVVKAQCDMVRALSEEKNIDLEVECRDDLPLVYQDQAKVQQILTNLLSNAIKFTPEGGRITVVIAHAASPTRSGDRDLLMTVTDTGVGIAEEDREIIFEKFRQARSTVGADSLTREYSGTGLGLSIVKELCKLLGGTITFESELGHGSSFCVRLPWEWTEQLRGVLPEAVDPSWSPPAVGEIVADG